MGYRQVKLLFLASVVLLWFGASCHNWCRAESPRQYYSETWEKKESGTDYYYFLRYYFKPRASDAKYQMHYVVYYPGDTWMYYYNPAIRTYWCRAQKEVKVNDSKIWVVLSKDNGRGRLMQIPADAWNRPHELPVIPGSDPGESTAMLAPPPPPRER